MRRPSIRSSTPRAAWLASLALLVAVAAAGCGGGGSGGSTTSTAKGTVGPAGGSVEVTSGALSGASIEVPAGALSSDLTIEIGQGQEMVPATAAVASAVVVASSASYQAGGPAVAFSPEGATFTTAVTITLPMRPDALPDGASSQDVVVLFTADGGATVEALAPVAVDLAHGLVTVATTTLGTFEVAIVIHDPSEEGSIALTTAASSISEEGETTDATVARTGDLSRQVVIQLAASPAGVLAFPAQVTILPGQATARFSVQGEDNHLLDGTRAATLTATLSGATPSACVVLVVSGDVDEPPVADAIAVDTSEDAPVGGTLTATDVNDQAITFSIVADGTLGTATVTDASTGAFTYVPGSNANGTDTFTYKATANGMDSAAVTVTVTIAAVNDAPVGTAGSLSVTEDLTSAGTLAATDVESDAVTFAVTQQGAKGTVVVLDASAGTFQYTPNPNVNGADSFQFTASDASLTSTAQTIAVSITAVNDAPVAATGALSTSEDTAKAGALSASDVDSAIASYEVVTPPSKGALSLVTATGAFTFTPGPNLNGADSFTWRAIDTDSSAPSNVTTVSISITAVNDAPVAAAGSISTSEDTVTASALAASDVDSAVASYEVVTPPSKGSISLVTATGAFTFTPGPNLNGADSFTWRAIDSDSSAPSNTTTVSIAIAAVNDAPAAVGEALSTNEDAAKAGTLTASDVDSAIATYVIVSAPAKGSISLVTATGAFTYTPLSNTNGADVFTWRAVDSVSSAPSNVTSVTVAITAVNDAPTLDPISGASIAEDAAQQQVSLTGISRGPADEAGQGLSISASSSDATVIPTPSISYTTGATGTLSYTPAANRFGAVTITVTAQDTGGTALGGADTITRSFTVVVTPVNDVPQVSNRTYGLARNVTVTVSAANGLLQTGFVSDADPGDPLSAVLFSGPTFGTLDTFNADGSFSYHPPQDVTGTATFQYKVSDGVTLSAAATVSLQISSANAPPTATADGPFGVTEDATLTIAAPGILTNDVDADGDTLQAETVTGVPANQGTLTVSPNGAVSFTPAPNFFGGVSFTYRAKDPFGAASNTVSVSIDVTSANDAPSFAVTGGTGLRQFQEDSGANVIDIASISPGNAFEATAGDTVSFTAILESVTPGNLFGGLSVATTGQSSVTTNSITLTPAANVTGTASLRLRATDSFGLSSADTVIALQVLNVNDAPDFTATTQTAQEDVAAAITITAITAGPLEGELVSVSAQMFSENPSGLTTLLAVSPSGFQTPATNRTVSFTPGTDLIGSTQIRITATDAGTPASSTSRIVTVVVAPVNDAPQFSVTGGTGGRTINENGGTATIDLTGIRPGPTTATDETAGQTTILSASVQAASPGGIVTGLAVTTATAQSAGAVNSVTFAPLANTTGTATIKLVLTDSGTPVAASTTATVSYTVQNVNDAPGFTAIGGKTVNEDTPLSINVTGITAGPNDPDTLTLTVTTANATPANLVTSISVTPGTLGQAGGGATIDLHTVQDLNGSAVNGGVDITFKVQDDGTGALSKQETFHVTVTAVNDPPVADAVDMETLAGVAVDVPLSGTDVEGSGLTFSTFGSAVNGSVSIVGSTATFTPNGTFNATSSVPAGSFQYRASDGTAFSTAVTVHIYRTAAQKKTAPMVDTTGFTTNTSYSWPLPSGTIGGLAMASEGAGFDETQVQKGDALVTNGSALFLSPARKLAASPVAIQITSSLTSVGGVAYDSGGNRAVIAFNNGYGIVSLGSFDSGTGTLTPTQVTVLASGAFKAVAFDDESAPSFLFIANTTQIRRVTLLGTLNSSTPSGTQVYTGSGIGAVATRINGDLYFVEGTSIKILPSATGTPGTVKTLVSSVSGAGTVGGITFNSAGNLLVAVNGTSDFILEYHPVTANSLLHTRTLTAGSNPAFIAIDRNYAALQWTPTTGGAANLKSEVIVGAKLSVDAFPRFQQAGCNGCHYDAGGITSFAASFSSWSSSEFRTKIRNVNAGCSGQPLVSTSSPTTSYIPMKLSFVHPNCAGNTDVTEGRMPQGGPYFTETEIELFRSWIRNNAPND